MTSLVEILYYVSLFSVVIPIALYAYIKPKGKPITILFVLLITSLITEINNEILIRNGVESYSIANIYFTLQLFILSYLYYYLLSKKTVITIGIPFYLIFKIGNSLFFQSLNSYQSWNWITSAFVGLMYATAYYEQVYRERPTEILKTYAPIWINNAVFFYFSFNLLLTLLSTFVFTSLAPEISTTFWSFHNANNAVKNILFAVGIYYAGDMPKK